MAQAPDSNGTRLGAQPLTVRLPPRPGAAAAFAGDHPLVLAVEGLEGRVSQPVRINVFVNKPDADRATPISDPHFVGTIALLPRNGALKRTGTIFDVADKAGLDLSEPLRVTLVPVLGTAEATRPPRDFSLRVGKIELRNEN